MKIDTYTLSKFADPIRDAALIAVMKELERLHRDVNDLIRIERSMKKHVDGSAVRFHDDRRVRAEVMALVKKWEEV